MNEQDFDVISNTIQTAKNDLPYPESIDALNHLARLLAENLETEHKNWFNRVRFMRLCGTADVVKRTK